MSEEIKTIRTRKIELKLSDADVERVSELAGAHGLTVEELLENFIGDLVGGTYSNGSDERMYANQWFERCWFGMFPDLTFLRYLIEYHSVKEIIDDLNSIGISKEYINEYELDIANDKDTWKNIVYSDGKPCYSNIEEWRASLTEDIKQEREDIAYKQASIDECWKDYNAMNKSYENGTFEEEMKTVWDYWNKYQKFLGEEE